jgi:Fe-S cluster assembly ATP-binding protein
MGPNGSGKSTLAMAIMGHPKYEISEGSIHLDGTDLVDLSVDERARAGLFLGMQHPVEVQGVSVSNFLRTAKTAISGEAPNLRKWIGELKSNMENLEIDPRFATRDVNSGFSGGEKKRFEILSMEVLEPAFGILDEIDSGLDIDALKAVSEGINRTKSETKTGILLITHYTRILKYVVPDKVHVFVDGRIAETSGPELGDQLEAEGYERYQRIATL